MPSHIVAGRSMNGRRPKDLDHVWRELRRMVEAGHLPPRQQKMAKRMLKDIPAAMPAWWRRLHG